MTSDDLRVEGANGFARIFYGRTLIAVVIEDDTGITVHWNCEYGVDAPERVDYFNLREDLEHALMSYMNGREPT